MMLGTHVSGKSLVGARLNVPSHPALPTRRHPALLPTLVTP
jgi:hypothetical protein